MGVVGRRSSSNPDKHVGAPPPGFVDVRQIGEGAEGGAFAAVDAHTGARVVLKRVEPGRRAAVAHAFAVLRSVASPHLPAPRALADTPEGATWLVTDWVEGKALEAGPVDAATAVGEALALAHALAAIHGAGTHHGDVAPGNVVVTPTGGLVLVDLGQLGRVGTGTPGFLAPEVLAGGGGPAADRFALGCLLCWRLSGQVPWRRPEALIGVRSAVAVRRRLAGVLPGEVPTPVTQLLERLLMPDPAARPQSTEQLVQTLGRLLRTCQAGSALGRGTVYWLPSRWPYRGVSLDATVEALAKADRPRVVAIAGPPGAGRGRVVEEVIQALQNRGVAARLTEPSRLGSLLGNPEANWMEAWMTAPVDRGPAVVGFPEPPPWPGSLAPNPRDEESETRVEEGRTLALQVAARSRGSTLVLPVSLRMGAALERRVGLEEDQIAVVQLRAWTDDELQAAIGGVVEGDTSFVDALRTVTGGWPATTVRAVGACAAVDLQEPDVAAIERALARSAETVGDRPMDLGLARAVMHLHWRPDEGAARALPSHLHDGEAPHRSVVVEARRVLGPGLRELARAFLAEGRGTGLQLAIDADRADAIDAAAQGGRDLDLRRADGSGEALVEWLERGGVKAVGPGVRAQALRFLLAQGQAQRAIDLDRMGTPSAVCSLEAARAEQRLGRTEAALTRLESLRDATDLDLRLRACGLRWRLLVDAGRAAEAEAEADAFAFPHQGTAVGLALLWAAFAALAQGHAEGAQRWLDRATQSIAGADDRESMGLKARIVQLVGNLEHERGDLELAVRAWSEAAACFEAAGETVGALALRGSLAGIAVPMAKTREGLRHGRAAVQGLVARGQVQGLPEAVLALVQHLGRVRAAAEAEELVELVTAMTGPEAPGPVRARLLRIEAEVGVIGLRTSGPRPGDRREAERRFVNAARALGGAGLPREALEAWARAASLARAAGRHAATRAHLARARDLQRSVPDESSAILVALEDVALRLETQQGGALEGMLEGLRNLASTETLVNRGEVELASHRARVLLEAARRVLPVEHPTRRSLARQLFAVLETIMKEAPSNDRIAAVQALATEAGEDASLHTLLQELGEGARQSSRPVERVDPEAPRLERLLRMYRRLAREDRLEPLLEQVVDVVMDLTDAERGAVVVQPTPDQRLEVARELGDGSEGMKFSRSVIERVLKSGEPVLSVDAAADDRFDESRSISHLNLRSVLAVPLVFRSEVLGAVYVDHRLRRGNFGDHHLAMMEEFAELAALAVAHARALGEVREQAERLRAQGEELRTLLDRREAEVVGLREEVRHAADERRQYRGIVGGTPAMQRVFKLVDRLADSDVPVVVYGESGTGKELVARAIHDAGSRASGPFVAENCGAIPETLLESVLFGHAKGAFTGAQKSKAGLFEAADGGTIFLDEVSEMSPGMQTKLLRVLQEGEVRRVGENVPRPVDVRVIAASNRDLDMLVEQGAFRRDLYYRIHVVRLELPPLRERTDDIPALVESFLQRHARGRPLRPTSAAMRALAGYRWPGNVRELENEIQRWVALCEDTVTPEELSPAIRGGDDEEIDPDDLRIRPRVDRLERDLIARALERTDGNQTRAAELLGLSRFGLQKKLKRLADDGVLL